MNLSRPQPPCCFLRFVDRPGAKGGGKVWTVPRSSHLGVRNNQDSSMMSSPARPSPFSVHLPRKMAQCLLHEGRMERSGARTPTLGQAADLRDFICPSLRFDESGSIIVQMRKLGQEAAAMCPHGKRVAKPAKPRPASLMLLMSPWAPGRREGSQALSSTPICWPALQIPSS